MIVLRVDTKRLWRQDREQCKALHHPQLSSENVFIPIIQFVYFDTSENGTSNVKL